MQNPSQQRNKPQTKTKTKTNHCFGGQKKIKAFPCTSIPLILRAFLLRGSPLSCFKKSSPDLKEEEEEENEDIGMFCMNSRNEAVL